MGFLDRLANWLAPSVPAPAPAETPLQTVPPVPAELPGISAKTAVEICRNSKPSNEAKALLTLSQTPSQFLAALQEKHLSAEMVKVLAYGLGDREGVAWAAKCAATVAHLLPPAEVQALRAAQAWVKNPTAEKRVAVAAILKGMELKGPGSWAAQAAVWANGGAPKPPRGVAQRLTPEAVAAAVQLSSTIHARPEYAKPQMPAVNLPTATDLPNAKMPQVAGAAAQLGAGLSAPQVAMGGLAAKAAGVALPVPGALAGVAAHLAAPALPGMAGSIAAGGGAPSSLPGASAQLPASGLSGLAASAGGASLPAGSIPGLSGASMSNVGQMGSLPQSNTMQMELPVIPPAVHAFMFKEQQGFIALGLEIASGKAPLV